MKSRDGQARDALIGYDASGHLLFVVHILIEADAIRIISARLVANEERRKHEYS